MSRWEGECFKNYSVIYGRLSANVSKRGCGQETRGQIQQFHFSRSLTHTN